MGRKLTLAGLYGGVAGFCVGLLVLWISWLPSFYWLADASEKLTKHVVEFGIHLLCGPSPKIGCVSGLGMLLFFFLWPLAFCLIWAVIGATVSLAFTLFHEKLTF